MGLDQLDDLDADVTAAGGTVEHLPPLERTAGSDGAGAGRTVGAYLDDLAANVYSWTWDLPADRLAAAVAQVRQWVADEHGDPAGMRLPFPAIRWHRYVLRPLRRRDGGARRASRGPAGGRHSLRGEIRRGRVRPGGDRSAWSPRSCWAPCWSRW